jgi:HAD superfamily hydrolase (TIGR01549 family)
MIKAIIFDFDDTLVVTKTIRYKAIKFAGEKFYNLKITDSEIDKLWGKPFDYFIYEVFHQLEKVDILFSNYKSILSQYPQKTYSGTSKILNLLKQKYLLGILSASHRDLILSGMNDAGLDPKLFTFIQSSDDTTTHKPDPNVFLPSIDKFAKHHIDKSEILYVGDAMDDYFAATNAGINFCGIADRTTTSSLFAQQKSDYIRDIRLLPRHISDVTLMLK